eukprot:jgi/Mesvir1/3343/Mv03697-RA.1
MTSRTRKSAKIAMMEIADADRNDDTWRLACQDGAVTVGKRDGFPDIASLSSDDGSSFHSDVCVTGVVKVPSRAVLPSDGTADGDVDYSKVSSQCLVPKSRVDATPRRPAFVHGTRNALIVDARVNGSINTGNMLSWMSGYADFGPAVVRNAFPTQTAISITEARVSVHNLQLASTAGGTCKIHVTLRILDSAVDTGLYENEVYREFDLTQPDEFVNVKGLHSDGRWNWKSSRNMGKPVDVSSSAAIRVQMRIALTEFNGQTNPLTVYSSRKNAATASELYTKSGAAATDLAAYGAFPITGGDGVVGTGPLTFSGLADGTHYVYVIAKGSSGAFSSMFEYDSINKILFLLVVTDLPRRNAYDVCSNEHEIRQDLDIRNIRQRRRRVARPTNVRRRDHGAQGRRRRRAGLGFGGLGEFRSDVRVAGDVAIPSRLVLPSDGAAEGEMDYATAQSSCLVPKSVVDDLTRRPAFVLGTNHASVTDTRYTVSPAADNKLSWVGGKWGPYNVNLSNPTGQIVFRVPLSGGDVYAAPVFRTAYFGAPAGTTGAVVENAFPSATTLAVTGAHVSLHNLQLSSEGGGTCKIQVSLRILDVAVDTGRYENEVFRELDLTQPDEFVNAFGLYADGRWIWKNSRTLTKRVDVGISAAVRVQIKVVLTEFGAQTDPLTYATIRLDTTPATFATDAFAGSVSAPTVVGRTLSVTHGITQTAGSNMGVACRVYTSRKNAATAEELYTKSGTAGSDLVTSGAFPITGTAGAVGTGPLSFSELADGTYYVYVVAKGSSGTFSYSHERIVPLDATPPTVTL